MVVYGKGALGSREEPLPNLPISIFRGIENIKSQRRNSNYTGSRPVGVEMGDKVVDTTSRAVANHSNAELGDGGGILEVELVGAEAGRLNGAEDVGARIAGAGFLAIVADDRDAELVAVLHHLV